MLHRCNEPYLTLHRPTNVDILGSGLTPAKLVGSDSLKGVTSEPTGLSTSRPNRFAADLKGVASNSPSLEISRSAPFFPVQLRSDTC